MFLFSLDFLGFLNHVELAAVGAGVEKYFRTWEREYIRRSDSWNY